MWDAASYERNARFVSDLGAPLVDLLAPQPGERILDVGCGDGALTGRILERGASVVGIDMSESFVEAARARGLDARLVDAQQLAFENEFDGAFSNAALHWMPDQHAVLSGIARALRPGGRFVGELGAQGNVSAIMHAFDAALVAEGVKRDPDPWTFLSPEAYRALLETAGFTVESIAAFERPTPLATDLVAWLETFALPLVASATSEKRAAVFARTQRSLEGTLRRPDGIWVADYVRLRFVAHRP